MNETTMDAGVLAASSSEPAARVNIPFEFRATGGEYFRIWIVNLLLTIVTLGIYSAWAKVRRLRYFYGSTVLDGHSFEYHARPIAILKGRIIIFIGYVIFVVLTQMYPLSLLLFLPLLLLGVPWIIVKARLFQMRMTSYRNLRFNFHGTYGGAMAAFIGWYFLVILTLGIIFPMWVRRQVAFILGNTAFGTTQFRFVTGNGRFFAFCYAAMGLGIVVYAGFIFMMFQAGLMNPQNNGADPARLAEMFGIAGLLKLLVLAIAGVSVYGYYQAAHANASIGGIEIGQTRVVSQLRASSLIWIQVTNLLGVLFTLGLFYPWAKVRAMKYHLENTSLDTAGGMGEFTASAGSATDPLGEELGDFFDMDFGI
jgi:uncharacterized membrane protein YjgN (DUF898 family)